MTKTSRRKEAQRALRVVETQSGSQSGASVATGADLAEGIPPHVWALLQEAGELAAERLRDILRSPRFGSFRPSEQRALIDLALTRSYGLPVRRSLSVALSSSDTDAIAASLMGLQDALPERAPSSATEDATDAIDVSPGGQATRDD
jgi:hypothetical protein